VNLLTSSRMGIGLFLGGAVKLKNATETHPRCDGPRWGCHWNPNWVFEGGLYARADVGNGGNLVCESPLKRGGPSPRDVTDSARILKRCLRRATGNFLQCLLPSFVPLSGCVGLVKPTENCRSLLRHDCPSRAGIAPPPRAKSFPWFFLRSPI